MKVRGWFRTVMGEKMKIDQIYKILADHGQGDEIDCPNCSKTGFVFCIDKTEYLNSAVPKIKRLRQLFFCLHCDFRAGHQELKELGIEPEVET
jgi:hypothetical protein